MIFDSKSQSSVSLCLNQLTLPRFTHAQEKISNKLILTVIFVVGIDGLEAAILQEVIRLEPEPEEAIGGLDEGREQGSTEPINQRRVCKWAVSDLQEVVLAVVRLLQGELVPKVQLDSEPRWCCKSQRDRNGRSVSDI